MNDVHGAGVAGQRRHLTGALLVTAAAFLLLLSADGFIYARQRASITCVVAAGVLLAAAAILLLPRPGRGSASSVDLLTAGASAVLAAWGIILACNFPGTPGIRAAMGPVPRLVCAAVAVCGAGAFFSAIRPGRYRAAGALSSRTVFYATGLIVLLLRTAVVHLTDSRTAIDLQITINSASRFLFEGENPYAMYIGGFEQWLQFGPPANAFHYPPLDLLICSVFERIFGDFRYAYLASQAGAAIVLLAAAPPRSALIARVLALLVICWPRAFTGAWTEGLAPVFCAFAVILIARRPASAAASVAVGLFAGFKQYEVLLAPQIVTHLRGVRRLLFIAVILALPMLPFILWNAPAMYDWGIGFHSRVPPRTDSVSLPAIVMGGHMDAWPRWVSTAAGMAVSVAAAWLFRRRGAAGFVLGAVLGLMTTFLLHIYAFANYYFFVFQLLVPLILVLHMEQAEPGLGSTPEPLPPRPAGRPMAWMGAGVVISAVLCALFLTGTPGRAPWRAAADFVKGAARPGDAVYLRTASAGERAALFQPVEPANPERWVIPDKPPSIPFKRLWVVTHPSRAAAPIPEWMRALGNPAMIHTVGDFEVELYAPGASRR